MVSQVSTHAVPHEKVLCHLIEEGRVRHLLTPRLNLSKRVPIGMQTELGLYTMMFFPDLQGQEFSPHMAQLAYEQWRRNYPESECFDEAWKRRAHIRAYHGHDCKDLAEDSIHEVWHDPDFPPIFDD